MLKRCLLILVAFVLVSCQSNQDPTKEYSSGEAVPKSNLTKQDTDWAINLYKQAEIGMDVNDFIVKTGENPESKELDGDKREYSFLNKDNGITVGVGRDNTIIKKTLFVTDTAAYSIYNSENVNQELASKATTGAGYDEVCKVFGGEGLEYYRGDLMDDIPLKIVSYKWFNPDGSYIVANFNQEGELMTANYVLE